jgi:hypothetical protein
MVPVGMERFTASSLPTVAECVRQASKCDIYVGILAHRYGWIPDDSELSITELEYDAAKQAGRRLFIFQLNSSVADLETDIDQHAARWEKQGKLEAFRQKCAKDQMPARFIETSLGVQVLQALQSVGGASASQATAVGSAASTDTAPPEDTTESIMRWLTRQYVAHGFPSHKVWSFSPGSAETQRLAFAELRALGWIETMGLGKEDWRLTDAGQRQVMERHRRSRTSA